MVASIATVLFRFVVFIVKELFNTVNNMLCYAIIIRHGAFSLLNDFARLHLASSYYVGFLLSVIKKIEFIFVIKLISEFARIRASLVLNSP